MSPKIRFQCPACNAVLEAGSSRCGEKIFCIKCKQKLQIPQILSATALPRSQTILAPAVPEAMIYAGATGSVPSPAGASTPSSVSLAPRHWVVPALLLALASCSCAIPIAGVASYWLGRQPSSAPTILASDLPAAPEIEAVSEPPEVPAQHPKPPSGNEAARNESPAESKGPAIKPAATPPSVEATAADNWTFQDFQDYLATRGMKTNRGAGRYGQRKGMWFEKGDGKPIDWIDLSVLNDRDGGPMNLGRGAVFFVEPFASSKAAKAEAAAILDVQQKWVLSCGKYVVHGRRDVLVKLSKLLPNQAPIPSRLPPEEPTIDQQVEDFLKMGNSAANPPKKK